MALSTGETSLKNYPIAERITYLSLLATLAAADGVAEPAEVDSLAQLCQAACLGQETTQNIIRIAQGQSQPQATLNLEILKKSELRFTFLLDTILLAYADGKMEEAETQEIQNFAQLFEVKPQQLSILYDFGKELFEAKKRNASQQELQAIGKKYAEVFEVSNMDARALFLGGANYGFSGVMKGVTQALGVAFDYATTGLKATYTGVKALWGKLAAK
jgi:uncharacterized tellurite resistance protein B-like protein